jgi:hypothetical protein
MRQCRLQRKHVTLPSAAWAAPVPVIAPLSVATHVPELARRVIVTQTETGGGGCGFGYAVDATGILMAHEPAGATFDLSPRSRDYGPR